MKFLWDHFNKLKPLFSKGGKFEWLYPLFEAKQTFLFVLPEGTHEGAHIRDPLDTKRLMSFVIVALIPCLLFGIYNVGYQHYVVLGKINEVSWIEIVRYGTIKVIPIVMVSYIVGGLWEVLFSIVRRHEINEGFLVTGLLFPLTLPPEIPLWMVALGISFGVVIGKEVFGGTGMNIFNPALTARAFLFFAYPNQMSGDQVWVAGVRRTTEKLIDGFTGATPLARLTDHAQQIANQHQPILDALYHYTYGPVRYTFGEMFVGRIPGSIGETSTLICVCAALFLILTRIASWRIMLGVLIGAGSLGIFLNWIAPSPGSYLALPWYYHFVMGGFAFGTVFMATDPVTAPQTKPGKWIYGMLIGATTIIIRVFNASFMEGMMLAILFANVFSAMIDYFMVQYFIKRRMQRVRIQV